MNISHEVSRPAKPSGDLTENASKSFIAPIEVDGVSPEDLDYAIGLAKHYDADLWLLPISDGPTIAADVRGLSSYVRSNWSHRTQIQLWDCVLQARQRHYRTFPVFACGGNHAEQILHAAERLRADLIIVRPNEGGDTFAGLTRAEVDMLLRRSRIPILVAVRNKQSPLEAHLNAK
jgi:hypothetical protein